MGCRVDFADIDPETFCIDPARVAEQLESDTAAVIPVNIYGHPCDDDGLRAVCGELPIIYDGAQAYGAELDGKSLLDYGRLAVCSLHATKVLHSVEGGFVVSHSSSMRTRLCLLRAFGHDNDDLHTLGINAKMSEIHAAMAVTLLRDFQRNLEVRKKLDSMYRNLLDTSRMRFPVTPLGFQPNYGYFPVYLKAKKQR